MRGMNAGRGLSDATRCRVGLLQPTMLGILPGRDASCERASGEGNDPYGIGPAHFGLRAAVAVLALPTLMLVLTALAVVFGGR